MNSVTSPVKDEKCPMEEVVDLSATTIEAEIEKRKRAECMAHMQSATVQLALDLLVREPDLKGFFRGFVKMLIEQGESDACGGFTLDESGEHCLLKMAYADNRFYAKDEPDWNTLSLPGEAMAAHLMAHEEGWNATIEYAGDDPRLPEAVRAFNRASNLRWLAVAPLTAGSQNLGWLALSTTDDEAAEWAPWRRMLLEAVALQVTLALHHNRMSKRARDEERRKAVLEERNRIARDIHDTLAQGFAAILMQLQSTQRLLPSLPSTAAESIETAVDLARTHMIEARRSVGALRPQDFEIGDVAAMQERAERIGGSLTIVTAPRAGTEVVLAWAPPSFSIPTP